MRKNKRLAEIANPLQFIGVPKGISFDDTQDKFTPVVPLKV
jgi:hypothetical protein